MDRDPAGYARTIQGEHAHRADQFRREAAKLRTEADGLEAAANFQEERAAWAGELADRYEATAS